MLYRIEKRKRVEDQMKFFWRHYPLQQKTIQQKTLLCLFGKLLKLNTKNFLEF